jgi:hypothetical protein
LIVVCDEATEEMVADDDFDLDANNSDDSSESIDSSNNDNTLEKTIC